MAALVASKTTEVIKTEEIKFFELGEDAFNKFREDEGKIINSNNFLKL